jgi:hypothetical protein
MAGKVAVPFPPQCEEWVPQSLTVHGVEETIQFFGVVMIFFCLWWIKKRFFE